MLLGNNRKGQCKRVVHANDLFSRRIAIGLQSRDPASKNGITQGHLQEKSFQNTETIDRRKKMKNTITQKQPEPKRGAYISIQDADRLNSWKEIAHYLNRDVRTIQRWEAFESLPIHRQFHRKSGTVHGYKTEIDAWRKNRSYRKAVDREQKPCPTPLTPYSMRAIEKEKLRKLLEVALAELIAELSISAATRAPDTQVEARIAASGQGSAQTQEGCSGNHLQSPALLPNMQ